MPARSDFTGAGVRCRILPMFSKTTRGLLYSLLCLLASEGAGAQVVSEERITKESEELVNIKGLGRTMREIQNRHGGILDGKLTQLCQELLSGESDLQRYLADNKSRTGALIYAGAAGGAGQKTVKIVYYAKSDEAESGGPQLSKIKKWVFDPLTAEAFASKAAKALQTAGMGEFTVATNFRDNLVEVAFHRVGTNPEQVPIVGESTSFR